MQIYSGLVLNIPNNPAWCPWPIHVLLKFYWLMKFSFQGQHSTKWLESQNKFNCDMIQWHKCFLTLFTGQHSSSHFEENKLTTVQSITTLNVELEVQNKSFIAEGLRDSSPFISISATETHVHSIPPWVCTLSSLKRNLKVALCLGAIRLWNL